MKCPIDGEQLVMAERSGVEIDYCPSCRGVWLDRGELDKIIERSAGPGPAASPTPPPPPAGYPRGDDRPYRGDDSHHRRKKRGGFLEDLFDF
jgi:uncharacterized protein